MGPFEREMARRRGQRKLDAMKRRAARLRRRVVATAIIAFAGLWTAVFVQMATGHDPALAPSAAARPATKESAVGDRERPRLRVAVPPPGQEDEETRPATESEAIEASRLEAERLEVERLEAEAGELEELEAVTTGQS